MAINNKKPALGAGFPNETRGVRFSICTPILPQTVRFDNPHLKNLRAQAATLMDRAEAAQDWPTQRRHYWVYITLLDAETGRPGGIGTPTGGGHE